MSWQTKQLKKLSEISYGYTTKASFDIEGPRFLRITDIQEGKVDWNKVPSCDISEADYIKHKLQVNDIVFARTGATTGKSFLITQCENSVAASYLIRVRINSDELLPEFLSHFFQSKAYWDAISIGTSGSAQGGVNASKLGSLIIPLAPPEEQKRIVAILDQAFADIDKARATAECNLKNARELFDSYLQQVFSQLGKNSNETTLDNVAEVSSGGTPLKSTKAFWDGQIPWYSSGELNDTYTISSKNLITNAGLNGSNAKLFPKGSLLIGMYDTAALKMSILDREGAFNQAIAGVKPNDNIDLEFVLHAINYIKPELLKLRRGVRQKNLNQSKIKAIPLLLPDLDTQKIVVSKLRSIKEHTEKLRTIYQQKLVSLEQLKSSILQKAFTGELT
jgi:type I restriction enzyme S subunit